MEPEVEANINSARMISSVEAATLFGVTNDYITQLCRKGKVVGKLEGRVWTVEENSIRTYLAEVRAKNAARNKDLSAALHAVLKKPQEPIQKGVIRREAKDETDELALPALFAAVLIFSIALTAISPALSKSGQIAAVAGAVQEICTND